ncbi:MAG: hypothetical protein WBE29_20150, partial [Pseudolabrys sp.]
EAQIIIESWRPACLSRPQTTNTGGLRACAIRVSASSQLTLQVDHSMKAGHGRASYQRTV